MNFVRNQKIIVNFKTYDSFLSSLKPQDKNILLSLKMMYSIHMENNELKNIFVFKQLLRFTLKLLIIPFVKIKINGVKSRNVILAEGRIEENLSKDLNLSLIDMKKTVTFNFEAVNIYKNLYQVIFVLIKNKRLNRRYILSLLHRLIDYLLVYRTIDIKNIKVLLIENDRLPSNLALIHRLKEDYRKTIKYDNWLIDPVNHNDVYCEFYFYPSLYHRGIIQSFNANKNLKYIEGGFLDWDRLDSYIAKSRKKIIYFTQFGIDISIHLEYIGDIVNVLKIQKKEYLLIVKTHPRENIKSYQDVLKIDKDIELIDNCEDIYSLISEANFCFSIFSTISLEAKHIIENSYFINYQAIDFDILDYDKLELDVITDKKSLEDVLAGAYKAIDKEKFIEKNNCTFPNTINKMQKVISDD